MAATDEGKVTDEDKVNLMLIASGGGTDADSIMKAWKAGQIPEVGNIILVSTHKGAGCLAKANALGVPSILAEPPNIPLSPMEMGLYKDLLNVAVEEYKIGLIFLVGCVVVLPVIPGVPMYNIHPADTHLHGGVGMYGLKVHEHVLSLALKEIQCGKKKQDRVFTYPTVHEVTAIPDGGPMLLRGSVEIPKELLFGILNNTVPIGVAAKVLQEIVLPYEWQMLPTAVRMAAKRTFWQS